MAIYTVYGSEVEFLTARLVPVWVEDRYDEIKHHFSEPKKTKKTVKVQQWPFWYVTAKEKETGRLIHHGKLVNYCEFRADDGAREITAKVCEMNPDHAAKDQQWRNSDGPQPSDLFETVTEKMVA